MKKKKERPAWLRPSSKWTDILIIAVVLEMLLSTLGALLSDLLWLFSPVEKGFRLITASDAVLELLYIYYSFIGCFLLFLLVCVVFRNNRPMLRQLAPTQNGRWLKGALIGLLLGFGFNGLCVLMSTLLGDITLFYYDFDPPLFFTFLLLIFIQSGTEELIDRVYLYQKLRRRYRNPAVAILGNAFMFSVMHLFNPGFTVLSFFSILFTGILCSLFVYYYNNIWIAIMLHSAWNFTQNILFGLPNSGLVSEYSLFKLEAASARNGFFYTVNFGVEGSLGEVLISMLLIAAVLWINRGKPEKCDLWAETAENQPDREAIGSAADLAIDSPPCEQEKPL